MGRGSFLIGFILLSATLLYSPVERVNGLQNGYCFQEPYENLFRESELPQVTSMNLDYEGVNGKLSLKIYSDKISLINFGVKNEKVSAEEKIGSKYLGSSEKCEFYFVEEKRSGGVLKFELSKTKEDIIDGRKFCYYGFNSGQLNEIKMLPGKIFNSMVDICKDLVNGRPQTERDCASTAECDINIADGESAIYGIAAQKDLCRHKYVYQYSNQPISSEEIDAIAGNFVIDCENGKSDEKGKTGEPQIISSGSSGGSAMEKIDTKNNNADQIRGSGGCGIGGGINPGGQDNKQEKNSDEEQNLICKKNFDELYGNNGEFDFDLALVKGKSLGIYQRDTLSIYDICKRGVEKSYITCDGCCTTAYNAYGENERRKVCQSGCAKVYVTLLQYCESKEMCEVSHAGQCPTR